VLVHCIGEEGPARKHTVQFVWRNVFGPCMLLCMLNGSGNTKLGLKSVGGCQDILERLWSRARREEVTHAENRLLRFAQRKVFGPCIHLWVLGPSLSGKWKPEAEIKCDQRLPRKP
jgi:hypothetical protein